jgi:hypothetical protein
MGISIEAPANDQTLANKIRVEIFDSLAIGTSALTILKNLKIVFISFKKI